MGSLDSVATDSCLISSILFTLFVMPANSAMHQRNDQLFVYGILGYLPADDDAKVGAALVGLLLEVAFSA